MKPQLYFYNTEKREKIPFSPRQDNLVKMYTCGPTVYDFAHIGNFRTFVFEDILRRSLRYFGYQVIQAMNLTDVDDKTIRGATEKNLSLEDFTQPFINAFFVDLQSLSIEPVEYYPKATDYIPYMIDFIQRLIDKNIAYKSSDKSIYFSIDKFPSYGRLSHLPIDDLQVGAGESRMANDEYDKDNASDFVLWKAYDPSRDGKIYWESPFGKGRPGWHLECSTMAMHLLGETVDIHVGAVDNIFPHHENEIAQSECYSEKVFVNLWMHAEHLLVNHKKMSKSLGNFYTLRSLLEKGYTGREIRFLLIQGHYRTQLNFTFEGLESARNALSRIDSFVIRMKEISQEGKASSLGEKLMEKSLSKFEKALADDLNMSSAQAALFDLIHEANLAFDKKELGKEDAHHILLLLTKMNLVFGVLDLEQKVEIPPSILEFLEKREEARKKKEWKEADFFRNEIVKNGYVIEDTPQGARVKKRA